VTRLEAASRQIFTALVLFLDFSALKVTVGALALALILRINVLALALKVGALVPSLKASKEINREHRRMEDMDTRQIRFDEAIDIVHHKAKWRRLRSTLIITLLIMKERKRRNNKSKTNYCYPLETGWMNSSLGNNRKHDFTNR